MGCDGGTIPRRDELVRVKKRPEAKDKDAERAFRWRYCTITQEILQEPIVVCHLGKLYSKMSLIEALLDRQSLPDACKHIKSLKDVKDLKFTDNPEHVRNEGKKDGALDHRAAPYICPVLGLEMSGKYRFVAVWSCGCVFSERALKELGTKNCLKCTKPFVTDDIVIINGTDHDLELMKGRMAVRRQNTKKNKEKKIKIGADVDSSNADTISSDPTTSAKGTKRKRQLNLVKSEESSKQKKLKTSSESSLSHIGNVISLGKVTKAEELRKIKSEYSVAKDEQASSVYKSLFTSHQSEKDQGRAHWVTYNPFYN